MKKVSLAFFFFFFVFTKVKVYLESCQTSMVELFCYTFGNDFSKMLMSKISWNGPANIMFTLYRIDLMVVWKSYRIGFLFTLQQRFLSWFSYRIALTTQRSQKWYVTQPAITCSKLTIETLEQGEKYFQS